MTKMRTRGSIPRSTYVMYKMKECSMDKITCHLQIYEV